MINIYDIPSYVSIAVAVCGATWLFRRGDNASTAERCSLLLLSMWSAILGTLGIGRFMDGRLWSQLASPPGAVMCIFMLASILGGIPFGLMCDNAPRHVTMRFYRGTAVCMLTATAAAWLFIWPL